MDVLSPPTEADNIVESDAAAGTVRFGVIKRRAASVLGIPEREVTHERLADLFGVSVRTIGRYAKDGPLALETATAISRALDLPIPEFVRLGGVSA